MTKIKRLLDKWPLGTVAVDSWLKKQGVYSDLRRKYIKSGWILSIGRGAFIRSGDNVNWKGALYPLQNTLNLPIHIGGKTSLEQEGYGHFIKLNKDIAYIYVRDKKRLPKWFMEYPIEQDIKIVSTNFLPFETGLTQEINLKNAPFDLIHSVPERAFLELLYLVPKEQGFQEAYLIAQGLSGLRPKLMQDLLEQCKSIKTKRLALFFGDFLKHEWFKRLDKSKISLGRGDRSIIKEGKYNKKYNITIPKDFEHDTGY